MCLFLAPGSTGHGSSEVSGLVSDGEFPEFAVKLYRRSCPVWCVYFSHRFLPLEQCWGNSWLNLRLSHLVTIYSKKNLFRHPTELHISLSTSFFAYIVCPTYQTFNIPPLYSCNDIREAGLQWVLVNLFRIHFKCNSVFYRLSIL